MVDESILDNALYREIAKLVLSEGGETDPAKSVVPQLTIQDKSRMPMLQIPQWFDPLRPYCEALLDEHPDLSKNVFIIMKFYKGNQQLDEIHNTIKKTLALYGLNALRADERHYASQLWDNVRTYMLCCQYGIAVLEKIIDDECNPNVTLEYGFMNALNRPIMLLVEEKMKKELRADITGTIFYSFDEHKIKETVREAIKDWAKARLGLSKPGDQAL
jgi:hypothetical protein